jgi:hypothetical protein
MSVPVGVVSVPYISLGYAVIVAIVVSLSLVMGGFSGSLSLLGLWGC